MSSSATNLAIAPGTPAATSLALAPGTPAATSSAATSCDATHCITCGDDGEPMQVLAVDGVRGLALCAQADGERHLSVEIALVEPVGIGEVLLVHAGTAIARIAESPGARCADRCRTEPEEDPGCDS